MVSPPTTQAVNLQRISIDLQAPQLATILIQSGAIFPTLTVLQAMPYIPVHVQEMNQAWIGRLDLASE